MQFGTEKSVSTQAGRLCSLPAGRGAGVVRGWENEEIGRVAKKEGGMAVPAVLALASDFTNLIRTSLPGRWRACRPWLC